MRVIILTPHEFIESQPNAFLLKAAMYGYSTALVAHGNNMWEHLSNSYGTVSDILRPADMDHPVFFLHEILHDRCTQPMYLHILTLELAPEFANDPFLKRMADNLVDVIVLQGDCFFEGAPKDEAGLSDRAVLVSILLDHVAHERDMESFFNDKDSIKYTPRMLARRAIHSGFGRSPDSNPMVLVFEDSDGEETHVTIVAGKCNPMVDLVMQTREFAF